MSEPSERRFAPLSLKPIVPPLLDWYARNARALPWRENTDPYRVWVSEIMLQQTRVEAAKPYFERFLRELPTIEALAQVEESRLLKLWEGLGYYSRARNLQKAAQRICREHGGVFPRTFDQVRALPGIGEYTAGAICSIAFGQPRAAVDGNVLRVAARLFEDGRDIKSAAVKKELTGALQAVYPPGRCGDFTQSLMELGAVVCLPGAPKCPLCPLGPLCSARRNGTQGDYPRKPAKKARRQQTLTVLLLVCDGRLALRRRAEPGLLSGLWELPNLPGLPGDEQLRSWLNGFGLDIESVRPYCEKRHIFTHVEWQMHGKLARCRRASPAFTWAGRAQLQEDYALPTAFGKFLDNFDFLG